MIDIIFALFMCGLAVYAAHLFIEWTEPKTEVNSDGTKKTFKLDLGKKLSQLWVVKWLQK